MTSTVGEEEEFRGVVDLITGNQVSLVAYRGQSCGVQASLVAQASHDPLLCLTHDCGAGDLGG